MDVGDLGAGVRLGCEILVDYDCALLKKVSVNGFLFRSLDLDHS